MVVKAGLIEENMPLIIPTKKNTKKTRKRDKKQQKKRHKNFGRVRSQTDFGQCQGRTVEQ